MLLALTLLIAWLLLINYIQTTAATHDLIIRTSFLYG